MNIKRILALIICAVMLLTMFPVAMLTTGAADIEGDWTTYRSADEYETPEEGEEPIIYKPEAGYEYTSEGFTVVPADYKDTTPFMTVQTKEKQSIKDGIYVEFRIDDFSYDGGTGADHWICVNLNTKKNIAPGKTAYGGGWLSLIRGNGDGNGAVQPHLTDPATEEFGGTFRNIGSTQGTATLDDQNREIYTFEVTWNGSEYEMKVNGSVVPGAAESTALLEKLDANGEFYVGITMQSGAKDGTAALTILKYGTSAADATTPVGSDSKKPEENEMTIADIADPSTVEANKPAILWTPETYNMKPGNNCTFTVLGDDTWRVDCTDTSVFMYFTPKRSWSWSAEDFPVFGVMLRNIWADSGSLLYCAGEVMAPTSQHVNPFSIYDGEFYGNSEEYVFVPIDLTDLWEGRINDMRLDLRMDDPESRSFDLCFAGMFRSEEEAYAYAGAWLTERGVSSDPVTEAPTESPTEAPEAQDTEAPAEGTQDPTDGTQTSDTETDAPAQKGCGSVIGMGTVAVLTAAAATVALKKKD